MNEHAYIRVKWLHDVPNDPVELWSELDGERFEVRKLEIFCDGAVGYASIAEAVGGTQLATAAVPSLNEIASDQQFEPEEISKETFDEQWEFRRAVRVRCIAPNLFWFPT